MATNQEASAQIVDIIVGGPSTQAQQLRFAEILHTLSLPDKPFDELTNAEKAAIIPKAVRQWGRGLVRNHNRQQFDANAESAVDAEFSPTT